MRGQNPEKSEIMFVFFGSEKTGAINVRKQLDEFIALLVKEIERTMMKHFKETLPKLLASVMENLMRAKKFKERIAKHFKERLPKLLASVMEKMRAKKFKMRIAWVLALVIVIMSFVAPLLHSSPPCKAATLEWSQKSSD